MMKLPPFLLGAALAFWGWQSDFLLPGLLMAVIAESARFIPGRWEISDEDFSRVWTFCSLLFLAAGVYAFNATSGPANFGRWLENPNYGTQGSVGLSTARTGTSLFRWLPMIFFLFLATQLFSTRGTIPLGTISLLVRRRNRKAKAAGRPLPPARNVDISWAYFTGTMMAASVHSGENTSFFWGMAVLLAWALWSQRSRRFGLAIWAATLTLAVGLGFGGQFGYGILQTYVQTLNPEWLVRFTRRNFDPSQTTTALGQIGDLKTSPRIAVRLYPRAGDPVPTYLREASYRSYTASGPRPAWLAGSSRNDFSTVGEEIQNGGSWSLLPKKTNTYKVNIACYLEGYSKGSAAGLLPVPQGVGRIENLPAYVMSYNTAGAILVQGPGLVIFDAMYGPGATLDSPPGTGSTNRTRVAFDPENPEELLPDATNVVSRANEDLQVPENERRALDQGIESLNLQGLKPEEKLQRVAGYFARNFTYSTWQPFRRLRTNETALSRFLLNTKTGHCEYFATAATLLLRRLEIPARYGVGYLVHERSGDGYVVRLRDAHAWCLVWNETAQRWDDFDTTPGSWIAEEAKNASVFQWLGDAWARLKFEIARLRWGQTNLRDYLLYAIIPGLGLLLYQIFFRRGRKRQRRNARPLEEIFNWPGLDSEFYKLEKRFADEGVPRRASEPLNVWLGRVATAPGLAELGPSLQEILRLHYRYRFDPLGLDAADREILRREVANCLEKLAQRSEVKAR